MAKVFRAGAATSNITPPLGISINGSMSDIIATHIHDELHARCLVLDDGETRLAFVVVDNCLFPNWIHDEAKHLAHGHTELPPDHILTSATHTHSAGALTECFQSEPNEEYAQFVILRISDAIRRAINNLAPAKIGWGVGREPTQVFNRRWEMKPGTVPPGPFAGQIDHVKMNPPAASADLVQPSGPTDSAVSVLSVTTPEGRPLAMLANYSLHYVGGVGPGHISADYFGEFAHRVAHLLGAEQHDPPFVGIMSNGTSGNINNIDFRRNPERREPYQQIRFVADLVAREAARVHKEIKFHDYVRLAVRGARVTLKRRLPTAAEVKQARDLLAKSNPQGPLAGLPEIYAHETVRMATWPAEIECPVQAIRIGELAIAALPCEVFVETGLAIKAISPYKPTFTVSLANGYAGYLPTVAHHKLGGYETWRARSSFLEVEAEPALRDKVVELLGQLHRS